MYVAKSRCRSNLLRLHQIKQRVITRLELLQSRRPIKRSFACYSGGVSGVS